MSDVASVRDAFGKALVKAGRECDQVVVLDADLASSTRVSLFASEFPERFIQCGIAEQNMIGVAAGLAASGYIPVTCTFGVFASKRVCDQVSISVAYPRLNVKMVGAYSGLFTGKTGATHQAIEDIAIMRSIPNLAVVVPGDAVEMASAVEAVIRYEGPVYLRVARDAYPVVFGPDYRFQIGTAVTVREGTDLTIMSTGIMVSRAIEAADRLAVDGVHARVVHIPTIKPIDERAITRCASETGAIVTVENHSIIGGLGSAVAEVVTKTCPVPVARVGIRDTFAESGADADLAAKYGMTADAVYDAASRILRAAR